MKQYRVFIKEGIGQVVLKNQLGQVTGVLDPETPSLIFNEMVFSSMGQLLNAFTRQGYIGFETVSEKGLVGPIFEEMDFNFPPAGLNQPKPAGIVIHDPKDAVNALPEKPPSRKRLAREENPTTMNAPKEIIIVKRKTASEETVGQ